MTDSPNCFRNVLLATDFSEAAAPALETAIKIARACRAKLIVAHVVPDAAANYARLDYGDAAAVWAPSADDLARLQSELRTDAEEKLRRLVSGLQNTGLKTETDVLIGLPHQAIIDAVAHKAVDLVVTGTRGVSAFKRIFVGSTATRLARLCPVPVWVARHGTAARSQSVLAAVDFSPLSSRVISVAASLASALKAELHFMHVYDPDELGGLSAIADDRLGAQGLYQRLVHQAAIRKFEELLAPKPTGVTATYHVGQGAPYQVIDATAEQINAGLVVVGSVGRRGISALLIGNTAEKVLHTLDRSLLVVKPAETPLPSATTACYDTGRAASGVSKTA